MKKQLMIIASGLLIVGLAFGISYTPKASASVPGTNTVISVTPSGTAVGNEGAYEPVVSADGSSVIFVSASDDLVSGDTGSADVYERDLSTNTTTPVDVSSSGALDNSGFDGYAPGISENGRYTVFGSTGTNLIDGQTTRAGEMYIHDMVTGTTTLVTVNSSGQPADCGFSGEDRSYVSNDGKFVVFQGNCSDLAGTPSGYGEYIYRVDMANNNVSLIGDGSVNGESTNCDGSLMVFTDAGNLTSDASGTQPKVYLADFRDGLTLTDLTSTFTDSSTDSFRSASTSCNGNYVTFSSDDPYVDPSQVSSTDTHYHVYLYNRISDSYSLVDQNNSGTVSNATSGGGSLGPDSFVSVDDNGDVVFYSNGTNLGSSVTNYPSPDPGQVWLRDNSADTTQLLSINSSGAAGNYDHIHNPDYDNLSISSNGKIVAYATNVTNFSSLYNSYENVYTSATGL